MKVCVLMADSGSQFCSLQTGTTCPTNFDEVGDECLYESTNAVSSSEGCLAECDYDIPAEVLSVAQREAVVAYATGPLTVDNIFFLGKQLQNNILVDSNSVYN